MSAEIALNFLNSYSGSWILTFHKLYNLHSSYAFLIVLMAHSWATLQELLLPTMLRVCIPWFLALIKRQKVFFQSILWMLLELVFTTSLHLFDSLISELGDHDGELDTCPSIILYLAGLCEDTKLEVRAGTSLICWRCGDVTGSNVVVFIGSEAGDIRADLFAIEDAVNAEVTKNLLCFIYDDERGDKVSSGITDPFGKETFSTVFFWRLSLWSIFETIMAILLKLV